MRYSDDRYADSRDDGRSQAEIERVRTQQHQMLHAPALRFSHDHNCYRAVTPTREVRVTRAQYAERFPELAPQNRRAHATLAEYEAEEEAFKASLAYTNWLDDQYTYTPKAPRNA